MTRMKRLPVAFLPFLLTFASLAAQDPAPAPPPPTQSPAPIVRPSQLPTEQAAPPAPVPDQTAPPAKPSELPSEQMAAPASAPPAAVSTPEAAPDPAPGATSQRRKVDAAPEAPEKDAEDKKGPKSKAAEAAKDKPLHAADARRPVLWEDPGDVSSKNLFWGQGGEKHQPKPPFVFKEEDKSGTNPKFDVTDANDRRWRVKLGEESRPEVVASRLLWAVGYFANDDYVLADAEVQNLKLSRGMNWVKHGHLTDARFARKPGGESKMATWEWKDNPFTGTQEFDGLRVMMAVMNNWDLKDINNSVYNDKTNNRQVFLVNDVGATFGTNSLSGSHAHSKGNVESFKGSKFIEKKTETTVNFGTPKAPTGMLVKTAGMGFPGYKHRAGMVWIGQNIPREHARWIGSLLAKLSHQQLVDAFRAGHFPEDQINEYVALVESRISELKEL
jgi:hypothetical protein